MNAMNTLTRPGTPERPEKGAAPEDAGQTPQDQQDQRTPQKPRRGLRDTDGMAVASFVLGLVGLLVFNLVLGPCALILGGLALARGTARRFRAVLGMALGAADLIVLATVVATNGSAAWSITG